MKRRVAPATTQTQAQRSKTEGAPIAWLKRMGRHRITRKSATPAANVVQKTAFATGFKYLNRPTRFSYRSIEMFCRFCTRLTAQSRGESELRPV